MATEDIDKVPAVHPVYVVRLQGRDSAASGLA